MKGHTWGNCHCGKRHEGPWNKGLTADTDKRVRKNVQKTKETWKRKNIAEKLSRKKKIKLPSEKVHKAIEFFKEYKPMTKISKELEVSWWALSRILKEKLGLEEYKRIVKEIKSIFAIKLGKSWKGRKHTEETKNKLRNHPKLKEAGKKVQENFWKNKPDLRKEVGMKGFLASTYKPTKPEKKMNIILEELYPNEWNYTGDGELIIGRKCPDFIHKRENWIIEVFGRHWHKKSEVEKIIDYYKSSGFLATVFWEEDIERSKVKENLKEVFYESV